MKDLRGGELHKDLESIDKFYEKNPELNTIMELPKQEEEKSACCDKCYGSISGLQWWCNDMFCECHKPVSKFEPKQEEEKICNCGGYVALKVATKQFECLQCGFVFDTPPITTKAEWEKDILNISEAGYVTMTVAQMTGYIKGIINQVEQDTEKRVVGEERLRSAKIVEELMEDSEHWQPIASRIMDRVIFRKEDLF